MKLRPAQEEILKYRGGRMAISAVPGSGKTFTLALLAAQLIADGLIDHAAGQQVLIVTYLNASVDTFRASIRQRLEEMGQVIDGYDVRTLHSLALEIVRLGLGLGQEYGLPVLDETQSSLALSQAVDHYIDQHPGEWLALLPDDTPQMRTRWRRILANSAQAFIKSAKNERYHPAAILGRLQALGTAEETWDAVVDAFPSEQLLLGVLATIYSNYQENLALRTSYDFDDLIWQAADLLEQRPHLASELRKKWPFVLEDEAQDSVPLQEVLIGTLTGKNGNWVRVGDPNQAITSTFTAAHPRFFNHFLDQPGVVSRPLPNSGRCAPLIFEAANSLMRWVIEKHPVPEVRRHAFRRQEILATPPGDGQPNPPDGEAAIHIKVYKHREERELPAVARLAVRYAKEQTDHTLAVLVPTNQIGYDLAHHLDELGADYDSLLRSGGREQEIAAAMHAVLALLANPLSNKALISAHASLHEMGHPAAQTIDDDLPRLHALLRSVLRPESLLFPRIEGELADSLPSGIVTEDELRAIGRFAVFLRRMFEIRLLPIDDLALALGDELFTHSEAYEGDLATAYQIASVMRRWSDTQPEWRLPEMAASLADVAEGRQRITFSGPNDLGFTPQPGRLTLATQHSAKGLEWDAVFLVGIDGMWIPGSLEAPFLGVQTSLGGDPAAEAIAQLRILMEGDTGAFEGRSATEAAHIEVINERLRLLYVGITRARRYLHISRSRASQQYGQERVVEPATVLGVLYRYLKAREDGSGGGG